MFWRRWRRVLRERDGSGRKPAVSFVEMAPTKKMESAESISTELCEIVVAGVNDVDPNEFASVD